MSNHHFGGLEAPKKVLLYASWRWGFCPFSKLANHEFGRGIVYLQATQKFTMKTVGLEKKKMAAAPAQCAMRFRVAIETGCRPPRREKQSPKNQF